MTQNLQGDLSQGLSEGDFSDRLRKHFQSLLVLILSLGLLILGGLDSIAGTLPSDVLAELNSYNVAWPSPSTNGSPGSMPLGNGDITANVWVENKGGDLMMYIGKSDTWSEGTRLLKVGRIRTHFSPNPFASGAPFSQTLNFYNGEIDIAAGATGAQVSLRIYIDANQPVIRIVASGPQNFTMSCSNEIWRNATQALNSGDSDSFRGVTGATPTPSESADQALTLPDRLVWYHQNSSSYFDALFKAENLNGYATGYADPWTNRIFGATILATNFSVANNQQLQSGAGTNFMVSIYPFTAQTGAETNWQTQMNDEIAQVNATSEADARTNHYAWWDAFWNRSWIFVSGDANATNVARGYLENRFMAACQGRGQYPIKFNGGTFTYDYNGQNGDFRAWGPGYWNQNTRLLYWPMLACGDFDMMMPFFNIYTNMLPLQTAATSKYYGHGGAFFPETFNIFGLYYGDDWGWNNGSGTTCGDTYITYHYQGGLETLAMMLDYYDYTQDTSFASNYIVPMATQVIRFFNEHWSKRNGKLFFYPANACEMYWSCTNSTDYISGLMADITKLVALPTNLTTPALINEWTNCYASLPPLPMDPTGSYVKPAQTYGAAHNSENPECYCIFPFHLYGLGLSNFDVGLATFNNRTVQSYKYDWSQDVIEEPLVGLTGAAQTDVINNFNDTDSTSRFQAYWATRNDYLPTEDTGGAAMSGLQYMAMQCAGSQILLLPAWPSGWNVDFKLSATSNTTVRLVIRGQNVSQLTVSPSTRTNDLVEPVPPAPAALTAYGGNGQAALIWTGSPGASSYNIKRSTMSGGIYPTIVTGVTNLSYIDTGLTNGTNYYYEVSAGGLWGEGANSTSATVTPASTFAVQIEGDLIVNLQSQDLRASAKAWTNRTINSRSVGNFTTLGGDALIVVAVPWNGHTVNTLFVNSFGNSSLQSALVTPAEINSNSPVSVEAWVKAVSVSPKRAIVNYGDQGGSGSPVEDREFSYDSGGSGVISGDFGNLDTAWTTPPNINVWHYLAYTWNGSTLTAYLDGVQNVQRNVGAICKTVQTFMQVGSAISGTGVNGGGDVADDYIACARVESGVLTAGDVAANYAVGPLGTPVASVSLAPPQLSFGVSNGQIEFSWPRDHLGWELQAQTNGTGVGLGTNWATIPGSATTNQMILPINPTGGSVFYRLVYP
ncbi:MAG TPA: DUF5703 domain-containing protein [Verrucomicrobiae bacterium]|jgi:hypothetical protein|nr:DUF5703 domain-containing protein [Verrucomicrobiae bacterium]